MKASSVLSTITITPSVYRGETTFFTYKKAPHQRVANVERPVNFILLTLGRAGGYSGISRGA
ncbi:hypothetical protein D3C77_163070 [compost metagenome]